MAWRLAFEIPMNECTLTTHNNGQAPDSLNYLLPLPRIDIPPRAHPHPLTTSPPLPTQKSRQNILVHQILLFPPLHTCHTPHILLLILRQNQIISPTPLASPGLRAFPLLTRTAGAGFGDRVHIASIVPLHVRFQVQLELPLLVRRARDPRKRWLSASRAELFGHVLGGVEAGMASEDELLDLCYALASFGGDEVEVDLEEDVLHCEVACHGGYLEGASFGSGAVVGGVIFGLVLFDVGRGDPAFI